MSKAVIIKKTGQRITIEDITTRNPQRTLEILVECGKGVWEGEKIEVTTLDAVEILEAEQERLVVERESLEDQKSRFAIERDAERARLREMTAAFEDEKKKFDLEKAAFDKKKKK